MYHDIWTRIGSIVLAILPLLSSSVPKSYFEFIALLILHVPIRYLPMTNVIIEAINSFLKPFIKFSTLLIKQDDNHEQQNRCHHHPFFFFKSFHKISPLKIKRGFGKSCCRKQGQKQQRFWRTLKKKMKKMKGPLKNL